MAALAGRRYEKQSYSGKDLGLPFITGCAYLRTPVASGLRPHEHDGYEITYLLSGQTDWLLAGGQSLPLVGGKVALIQAGVAHEGLFHTIEPCELVWMVFRPCRGGDERIHDLGRPAIERLDEAFAGLGNVVRDGTARMQSLAHAFRDLPATCRGEPALRRPWLRAILVQFLLESCRALTMAPARLASRCEDRDYQQACARYVEEHLSEPIAVRDLAGLFGLSESRFFNAFRQQVGMTPGDFVTRLRLRHAQGYLIDSAGSITDIAMRCGFSTSQYFARRFRQYVGTTPSEFRRRCRAASGRR
jgi:AraC-like DNA-binding protein